MKEMFQVWFNLFHIFFSWKKVVLNLVYVIFIGVFLFLVMFLIQSYLSRSQNIVVENTEKYDYTYLLTTKPVITPKDTSLNAINENGFFFKNFEREIQSQLKDLSAPLKEVGLNGWADYFTSSKFSNTSDTTLIKYWASPEISDDIKKYFIESIKEQKPNATEASSLESANFLILMNSENKLSIKGVNIDSEIINKFLLQFFIKIRNHNVELFSENPQKIEILFDKKAIELADIPANDSVNLHLLSILIISCLILVLFGNFIFSLNAFSLDSEKQNGVLIPFAIFKYNFLHFAFVKFLVFTFVPFILFFILILLVSQCFEIMNFVNSFVLFGSLLFFLWSITALSYFWSLFVTFLFRHILGRFLARMVSTPITFVFAGAWRMFVPVSMIVLWMFLKGVDLNEVQYQIFGLAMINLLLSFFSLCLTAVVALGIYLRVGKSRLGFYPA